MIKRKMLSMHVPQVGTVGDCLRTCIACLLDLEPEQVPHFLQIWWDRDTNSVNKPGISSHINDWMAERGLVIVDLPYDDIGLFSSMVERLNGKIRYIVTGRSATNNDHCVIYEGAEMVWDPSEVNAGLIGPASDGLYWMSFIVPLSMRG